jgi:hypothetical protein
LGKQGLQETERNGRPAQIEHSSTKISRNALDNAWVHSISEAAGALPDRMPICAHQKNDRLRASCVQEALDLALSTHDLVLLDAPPVLKSADTAMLIQHPAGVVLAISAGRDRLPEITATMRELSRLSPPVVGIVLRRQQINPTAVAEASPLPLLASRVNRATARVFSGSGSGTAVSRVDFKPETAG